MAFVQVPLADYAAQQLLDRAIERIMGELPGWEPTANRLLEITLEELTVMVDVLMGQVAVVGEEAMIEFGRTLVGEEPQYGRSASMLSTWTAIDDTGYTIPSGTALSVGSPSGSDTMVFETITDTVIPSGSTQVTGVELAAVNRGTAPNGQGGAGAEMRVLTRLAWVNSVAAENEAFGGVNPETRQEYLDRLAATLTVYSERPIVPRDYEVIARGFEGVYRALALDGYDAVANTTGNERTITVSVVDENGAPVDDDIKTELDTDLQDRRELNFIVYVADPAYRSIQVTFTATSRPGFVPAEVEADAEAALYDYLNPAVYGGGDESPPLWSDTGTLRLNDVIARLYEVPGLRNVDSCIMGLDGGSQTAGDLDLTGGGTYAAPLPGPREINGEVPAGFESVTERTTVSGTISAP